MKCSNRTRCDNPNVTFFDDIYACITCYGVFKKNQKNQLLLTVVINNKYLIIIIFLIVLIVILCVFVIYEVL